MSSIVFALVNNENTACAALFPSSSTVAYSMMRVKEESKKRFKWKDQIDMSRFSLHESRASLVTESPVPLGLYNNDPYHC